MTRSNEKGRVSTPSDPGDSKIMLWIRDVLLKHDGDDCLIWPFAREETGYGAFGRQKQKLYAHRYICELVNGPPPNPKDHAAHSCNNGPGGCVSGKHLSWKSNAENQNDRYRADTKRIRFKLTATQVEEIRSLRGQESTGTTAQRYGICEAHARQIQTGHARPAGKPGLRQFTDSEVRAIRQIVGKSNPKIAAEYGAPTNSIWRIRNRLSYKHVPDASIYIQQRAEK